MEYITKNTKFWSDDDITVLKAIREGFLETQKAMWKDLPNWRKTASGLPSTAGTTASICFIKRGKLFIGHVGDSGIMLGERDPLHTNRWRARRLTQDHKPECEPELSRIQAAGGKVVSKSGVPRVVWYRPSGGHKGPVRRSTHIDEVPFLAVARALGDLWSYNAKDDVYVVSPDPDLHVYDLNILKDRCLILGTDGVWNVLSPEMTVQGVFEAERNNEQHMINPQGGHTWINPSKKLVDYAIDRWNACNLRADNTSVVTVMLDPPGPPRAQVLRKLHASAALPAAPLKPINVDEKKVEPAKNKGIAIISRYPNSSDDGQKNGQNLVANDGPDENTPTLPSRIVHDSTKPAPLKLKSENPIPAVNKNSYNNQTNTENPVQCNEISSSDDESTPPPVPKRPPGGHAASRPQPRKSLSRELAALQQNSDDNDRNDGPSKRTRRQSGPAAKASKPPPPPLASRRSIVNQEDSDAENNLPNARQTRQSLTSGGDKKNVASFNSVGGQKRPKTPEISPRVLRSRNTPTPLKAAETRKRVRSFEPASIASKVLKTAQISGRASTSVLKAAASNTRAKCLRSRMN
jgi:serine/threonine protein phosphatase PrpC